MKKILLATLLVTSFTNFSSQAMDPPGTISFETRSECLEFLRGLRDLCEKDVKYPVPQYIKAKFIETALREVPELKTKAKFIFKELYYDGQEDHVFRNIVLDPRETQWKNVFKDGEMQSLSNYYRVFIGTQCPPSLENADIVPCYATVSFPPLVLVRADLKEVLVQHPKKGYVPVKEWREYYDKHEREKEELIADDFDSLFPTRWING